MENRLMSYEDFKKEMGEKFILFFPEEYRNCRVDVRTVQKNNADCDGITVFEEGSSIHPTMYIEQIYADYTVDRDFDKVMKKAADIYVNAIKNSPEIKYQNFVDISYIRDHVFMQLVNFEKNEERLSGIPHVKFLDLAIIFRVSVFSSIEGVSSYVLNNDIFRNLSMTIDELKEIAERNTKTMFPFNVSNICDVMEKVTENDLFSFIADYDYKMFVATNDMCINGAVFMTFIDELEKVADNEKSDLLIIPSTIHEVLLVPCKSELSDPKMIKETIHAVNSTIKEEEYLSYHLYRFDRSTKTVAIV